MISVPSGVGVWLAVGRTDMRRGMNGFALQVQQAWLADILRRIADHPASRLADLLPWNWKPQATAAAAA